MSYRLHVLVKVLAILLPLQSFADSDYDRCLVEAQAENAKMYCREPAGNDGTSLMFYNECLDARDEAAKAAAQKCKEQFAKKPEAPADDLLENKDTQAGHRTESTEPKKDQSRPNTDSTPKSTAEKKPSPTSTPKSDRATTPTTTSVADAQAQIQADLDRCTSLQNQASRCCGNPLSCSGSLSSSEQQSVAQLMQGQQQQPGQSMTDYCNQLKQQSTNSGAANNALSRVCATPQTSCVSTCDSMSTKYLNLANQNIGTDLESVYSSAADQFLSALNTCTALGNRATQLAAQGISSGSTQSMSAACQQASAASPTNMPTTASNPSPTSLSQMRTDATGNCQLNPTAPECKNQNLDQSGKSGFDTQGKKDGDFDVADVGARSTDYFSNNMQPSAAAKVGTVPNNTGGSFGGGGSGSSASLNTRSGGRPSPGSPGYTTDIMQGTTSGGGYTYGSGSGSGLEDQGFASRFFGRGKKQKDDHGGMLGMDLRQFLPGGSRDPRRALAGMNGHSEINAKEEDIWRRISNKMVEKCKLGVLWRCE